MSDTAYTVETRGPDIFGECACGAGIMVPNKGLGRAAIAAWKTQHQDCPRGYITAEDIMESAGFKGPERRP